MTWTVRIALAIVLIPTSVTLVVLMSPTIVTALMALMIGSVMYFSITYTVAMLEKLRTQVRRMVRMT
jgi:hypothetical protein